MNSLILVGNFVLEYLIFNHSFKKMDLECLISPCFRPVWPWPWRTQSQRQLRRLREDRVTTQGNREARGIILGNREDRGTTQDNKEARGIIQDSKEDRGITQDSKEARGIILEDKMDRGDKVTTREVKEDRGTILVPTTFH